MTTNNTPSPEMRNAPSKGQVPVSTSPAATQDGSTQSGAATITERYALTNRGVALLCVPIVGPDGDTQEVFLQPGGKPKIPAGYTVDSTFARRNPHMAVIKL